MNVYFQITGKSVPSVINRTQKVVGACKVQGVRSPDTPVGAISSEISIMANLPDFMPIGSKSLSGYRLPSTQQGFFREIIFNVPYQDEYMAAQLTKTMTKMK